LDLLTIKDIESGQNLTGYKTQTVFHWQGSISHQEFFSPFQRHLNLTSGRIRNPTYLQHLLSFTMQHSKDYNVHAGVIIKLLKLLQISLGVEEFSS